MMIAICAPDDVSTKSTIIFSSFLSHTLSFNKLHCYYCVIPVTHDIGIC